MRLDDGEHRASQTPPDGSNLADLVHLHLRTDIMYPLFYLRFNPDLAAVFGPSAVWRAREHFLNNGRAEGRCATPFFDAKFYLSVYPDLQAVFGSDYKLATQHWVDTGFNEGRRGSKVFDIGYYLNSNTDLVQAFGAGNYATAFVHWVQSGHLEGRRTSADGPQLRISAGNFAFGDTDQARFSASLQDVLDTFQCWMGEFLLVTAESEGRPIPDTVYDHIHDEMCHDPGYPMDKQIFNDMDKNQYDTDQAERNADTG